MHVRGLASSFLVLEYNSPTLYPLIHSNIDTLLSPCVGSFSVYPCNGYLSIRNASTHD